MMNLETPLTSNTVEKLKAGNLVSISGIIYTARDRAHKELANIIYKGRRLPFKLEGTVIYYCGPTPKREYDIIGSCGPTTSSRMDRFTPLLYEKGITATIGKGERSSKVIKAIKRYRGIYFITWGGCGAYLRKFVKRAKIVAFKELGPEAIYRLEVEDFPAIVAIDSYGRAISSDEDYSD